MIYDDQALYYRREEAPESPPHPLLPSPPASSSSHSPTIDGTSNEEMENLLINQLSTTISRKIPTINTPPISGLTRYINI